MQFFSSVEKGLGTKICIKDRKISKEDTKETVLLIKCQGTEGNFVKLTEGKGIKGDLSRY